MHLLTMYNMLAFIVAITSCAPNGSASKESLTSSLVALKTKPNDLKIEEGASAEVNSEEIKSTTRQKRSGGDNFGTVSLDVDHNDDDQVEAAAAVLAKYIEDTGDQEGVVEFLQFMVKSGKLTPKEVIMYVNKVMEKLKKSEESFDPHHSSEDLQSQRHTIQAENEKQFIEEHHDNKINKIEMEKKALTQSKEEIEEKLRKLQKQREEVEEEMKKKQKLTEIAKEVAEGENDNETILKINNFLEEQKNLNKISKSLYMHVKEALIETTVDNLAKITPNFSK